MAAAFVQLIVSVCECDLWIIAILCQFGSTGRGILSDDALSDNVLYD